MRPSLQLCKSFYLRLFFASTYHINCLLASLNLGYNCFFQYSIFSRILYAFEFSDDAAAVVIAADDYDDTDAVMLLLGQTENHSAIEESFG